MHFGTASYVQRYDSKTPVVEVLVIEDELGTYKGWIRSGDNAPKLIQRAVIFDIQFPDGAVAAEKDGKGKIVNLSIVKVDD